MWSDFIHKICDYFICCWTESAFVHMSLNWIALLSLSLLSFLSLHSVYYSFIYSLIYSSFYLSIYSLIYSSLYSLTYSSFYFLSNTLSNASIKRTKHVKQCFKQCFLYDFLPTLMLKSSKFSPSFSLRSFYFLEQQQSKYQHVQLSTQLLTQLSTRSFNSQSIASNMLQKTRWLNA